MRSARRSVPVPPQERRPAWFSTKRSPVCETDCALIRSSSEKTLLAKSCKGDALVLPARHSAPFPFRTRLQLHPPGGGNNRDSDAQRPREAKHPQQRGPKPSPSRQANCPNRCAQQRSQGGDLGRRRAKKRNSRSSPARASCPHAARVGEVLGANPGSRTPRAV